MKMRKIITVALALTVILGCFSGCSQSVDTGNESTTPKAPEVLDDVSWEDSIVKVGLTVDPAIFGPYQTTNKGRKQVLPEFYETLAMVQGVGGELEGVMAKSWYPAEGEENAYIVELYDYITDSKGNQITADDVIYSYTDAGANDFKRYLIYMDSIEKIDDFTLKITMNSTTVGAFDNLISRVYVIDEESFKADPTGMTSNPVGTGPYKLVEYTEGSKVVLQARDDYWQTDESKLCENQYRNVKTIEFVIIPEAAQQSIALETGTVDIMNGMSATAAIKFEGADGFNVSTVPGNNCRTIFFNCNESSVCSNLALRQAILYAIDSQELLNGVLDGAGEVAYCFGNNSYSDVYEEWNGGNYYAFDQEKAKELLKEAGYENGVTVRLLTFTGELESNIANILYAYLDQVGIKLEINQYEEALVKTNMRDFTTFDMFIPQRAAATKYVISAWYEKLSSTTWEDGLNYCGFEDPKLQALLDAANDVNTHSQETVTAVYEEMTENAYAYGMFTELNYTVYNDNVVSPCIDLDYWLIPGCCTFAWN